MAKRRRPTQEEVARLAGTSTAVVSYVLNNGPRPVSEDARRRVLAAIDEIGYRPNNLARALVSGKSSVLGLVVPDLANPFLAHITQCIERTFFGHGYSLFIGDSEDNPEREVAAIEAMLQQQIDALVWYSVDQPAPIDILGNTELPVVLLNSTREQGRLYKGTNIICVNTNEREHARLATEHLIAHGCERIAFLGGPTGRLNARERFRGYMEALKEAHLQPQGYYSAPFTRQGGFEAASAIKDIACDSIVVSNEMQGIGLLVGLHDLGVRVPEDVAVIAMNGTPASRFTIPSLSVLQLDIEQLSRDITSTLLKAEKTKVIRSNAHLQTRNSCGCGQ